MRICALARKANSSKGGGAKPKGLLPSWEVEVLLASELGFLLANRPRLGGSIFPKETEV